jgi:hypothetical protein
MGGAAVVDGKLEVVAEWKSEAALLDIAEARDVGREIGFAQPGSAAVARAAIVGIPQRAGAGVHPGDPHIAGLARYDRRERMIHAIWRERDLDFARPCGARVGRLREV